MGLKEYNIKGMMIKSDIKLGHDANEEENALEEPKNEGISQRVAYTGSSFE